MIYSNLSTSSGGSTPANPNNNNNKPSLKRVDNKEADQIARENGYKDAHAMKQDFVGKSNISKYDINTKTGEAFLEGIKNGIQIPTGFFK